MAITHVHAIGCFTGEIAPNTPTLEDIVAGFVAEIKEDWKLFKKSEPGKRFRERYERLREKEQQASAKKYLRLLLGVIIIAGGIVLLFIPGPGWLFIFFGAALLAGESCALATFLDKTEVRVRRLVRKARRFWQKSSAPVKGLIVFLVLCGAGAGTYGMYYLFIK